jgi:hypothetical protein
VCTALISVDPDSAVPVLLAFARDEMAERAWLAPGRHWPARPSLVGGMDLREGGSWLAVAAGAGTGAVGTRGGGSGREPGEGPVAEPARMACVLNGLGRPAPEGRRVSRGRLPLAAAEGALVHRLDLPRYDPFHLLVAETGSPVVTLLSWDGEKLAEERLARGTHLVSNRGLELEGADLPAAPERAERLIDARIRYFRPLLQQTKRPTPEPSRGTTRQAWGEWMRLAEGDGLDPSDVRALIGRHDWGHGNVWLTSSVSLVALGRRSVRYDVNLDPNGTEWQEVDLGDAAV